MRTADHTYQLTEPERIAAARWAAIDLLFPRMTGRRRHADHRSRWVPVNGWVHTFDSSGAIHSERAPA